MVKLIKLCFVCCLIFRATFVSADYQKYKEYIEALVELEQKYRPVDKSKEDKRTIELSGRTMGYAINKLRDILRLRADTKIGTSQEGDSHPALLKVNGVVYELYFHGTKDMPGNCRLKKQGEKDGKPWLTGKYEYNLDLNTKENYIEQNLLFCLEIARRSVKRSEEPDWLAFEIKGAEKWELPIAKITKDQFKDLDIVGVIVLGLNLVKQEKDCPAFGFFGSFDSKGNRAIIANNFIRASMKILALSDEGLFDLKVKFFKTKIDERIIDKEKEKYFKNNLSDMVKNKKVVGMLKKQNFTHYEQIPEEADIANFKEGMPTENVIKALNKSRTFSDLSFDSSKYKETLKEIVKCLSNVRNDNFNEKENNSKKGGGYSKTEKQPLIYVLDGNATKDFVKFLAPKNTKRKTNFTQTQIKIEKGDLDFVKFLSKKHFENGFIFLYATGKDDTTRWFYLNKSNGTMYLLSETPKS